MANIFDLFRQIETKREGTGGPITYLVVGLGNPGAQYTTTRHNAGFLALDYLCETYGTRTDRARFKALVGEATIGGARVLLMRPQTFMNHSGEAVSEAMHFYKLDAAHVIVLSDDISLDPGRLRVRRKGSAGGHNGLKSLNEHLGTDEYPRIKMGVGQKPSREYDLADWVLSHFSAEELKALKDSLPTLAAGLEKMLAGDVDGAMQICNAK